jgi:hypothetical protein
MLTMSPRLFCAIVSLLSLSACATAREQQAPIPAPELKVGDSWLYEQRNGYNRELLQTLSVDVTEAGNDTIKLHVVPSSGPAEFIQTLTREINPRNNAMVLGLLRDFEPAYGAYRFPLNVGQSWRADSMSVDPVSKKNLTFKIWGKVTGAQKIRVPAGEFDTLKIVRRVYPNDDEWWRSGTEILETEWYAPAVKRVVKREEKSEYVDTASGLPPLIRRGDWIITELKSFSLN